jgi:hypothetical protein
MGKGKVSPCSSEARAVWSRALERSERDVGLYLSNRAGGQRCWTMKVQESRTRSILEGSGKICVVNYDNCRGETARIP